MTALEAAIVEHGQIAVHGNAGLVLDEGFQTRVQHGRHAVENHASHPAVLAEPRETCHLGCYRTRTPTAVDDQHGRCFGGTGHVPRRRFVADCDAVVVAHDAFDDRDVAVQGAVSNQLPDLLFGREEQIEVARESADDLAVEHRIDVVGTAFTSSRLQPMPHERVQEPARECCLSPAASGSTDENAGSNDARHRASPPSKSAVIM